MAIGDIAGDIKTTYGQDLTPEQRAARQAALAQGGSSSLSTSQINSPPAGPIGRAQQQLAPAQGLSDPGFGLPAQGAPRQTSFDITNTPPKYLPPPAQAAPPAQPVAPVVQTPAVAPVTASPPAVPSSAPQPAPVSNLSQANLVTPLPQGPQAPPLTNLAQLGTTTANNALGIPSLDQPIQRPSLKTVAPLGPLATADSPAVDPYQIESVLKQNTIKKNASLIANPTPADPLAAPGPLLQDQYRPTGIGAGAQGGPIVATVGPNGEPLFSNAKADQQSAQGLGQISVSPPTGVNPERAGSLASLGSAGNLGDGIGTFSQSQAGDATLAGGRFARANELRQGYANQDRLDQANARNDQAAQLTVVHDSRKPITENDLRQSQLDGQASQTRQQGVINAQSLINANLQNRSGEQQLQQASSLNDLRVAASVPGATVADQNRYLAAADPKGFLQTQQKAPLAALEIEGKQLENKQKAQTIVQSALSQQQGQQDRSKAQAGQVATIDQAIGSIDEILGKTVNPKNPSGPYTDEDKGLSKSLGPIDGLIPSLPGTESADFKARLDTLKAQTFLPQVALLKGAGALSDSEGKKLTDSVGALSTSMSEGAFRKSLKEIRTSFSAAKERASIPLVASNASATPALQAGAVSVGAKPVQPTPRLYSFEEAKSLPPGTEFMDSTGVMRVKH
ncbi:MAG: hypothetical protein ACOH2R_08590 [Pseudomonas sp.]